MYNQGQNKGQTQQGQKQILSDDSSRGNVSQGKSGYQGQGHGQVGQNLGGNTGVGEGYGQGNVGQKAPSR